MSTLSQVGQGSPLITGHTAMDSGRAEAGMDYTLSLG